MSRGRGPGRPRSQRRTQCRRGHPLRGRNLTYKRQTDGRITRLCRQCFQARVRAWQRGWRARRRGGAVSLVAPDLTGRVCELFAAATAEDA